MDELTAAKAAAYEKIVGGGDGGGEEIGCCQWRTPVARALPVGHVGG